MNILGLISQLIDIKTLRLTIVRKSFSEVMSSRDATFWKEFVNDKMDSILSNNIYLGSERD